MYPVKIKLVLGCITRTSFQLSINIALKIKKKKLNLTDGNLLQCHLTVKHVPTQRMLIKISVFQTAYSDFLYIIQM